MTCGLAPLAAVTIYSVEASRASAAAWRWACSRIASA